jgi:hypothetical protein
MRSDNLQPHHNNFKVMGNRLGTSAPSFLANLPGLCKMEQTRKRENADYPHLSDRMKVSSAHHVELWRKSYSKRDHCLLSNSPDWVNFILPIGENKDIDMMRAR